MDKPPPNPNWPVVAPDGFTHVGWYCDHSRSYPDVRPRSEWHVRRKHKGYGYKSDQATTASWHGMPYPDSNGTPDCPHAVPMFVRAGAS